MAAPFVQGSVWIAEFEQGYDRPCVVLTREFLNLGRTLLVAPMTSSDVSRRVKYPNYVLLAAGTAGLANDSAVATHLAQVVDTAQMRSHLGDLNDADLTRVLHGLAWSVGLMENVD
jgi:mRNA-degrading endonuclease toxin of MazEF toxin-antitoxin module